MEGVMVRVSTLINQLWRDARFAEQHTKCRRRGCAARMVELDADDELFSLHESLAINGSDFCSSVQGSCGCVHAESLAIVQTLKTHTDKLHMLLTTLSPCTQCARLIVESEIVARVIYLREYRDLRGVQILRDAGIDVMHATLWGTHDPVT